ncbi:cytochrome c-type biogenesis protein CcmH [Moraxella nasovis]|nr:cytochrome c-type biogenesis protein [Moraxella nasovis]UNU74333.1 cytochrome c-type biogenesis protein CcmH [Moraxella nasovis]
MSLSMMAFLTLPALGAIEIREFDNSVQEARYNALIEDFRCPTCQNQNLAGSDAPIAQDLKQKTYEMIKDGRSDREIRDFMFERYGDFISYKPPIRPSTWILWFFPPILLIMLLLGWFYKAKGIRQVMADDVNALSADEEMRIAQILEHHQHNHNSYQNADRERP